MSRSAPAALVSLFASLVAVAAFAPAAQADSACSAYAATNGSDSAQGTQDAPLRTVQALADSLSPGDTGCLRAGSFSPGVVIRQGGTAGARVTLRSAPGEKATINGEVRVAQSAPYVTVSGLYINGASIDKTNPTINASDTTFTNNDVTNDHTEICFMLGNSDWGRADRAVIERNRIHDCGQLPSNNQEHGIYIAAATNAHIQNNWIYDNADRGIQLYPDAQNTTITGNIIDNNGEGIIISGADGSSSNNTRVQGNIISNSNLRHNVESWWPQGNPVPRNNVIQGNCLAGGRDGSARKASIEASDGLTVRRNVPGDPGFMSRRGRDFRLSAKSTCASTFTGDRSAVIGPDGPAPITAATTHATRSSISIRALRRSVRRGHRARLRGRIAGPSAKSSKRLLILARVSGHTRVVKRARVKRNGRFSVAVATFARHRAIRYRAVVPGIARSRAVRVATVD